MRTAPARSTASCASLARVFCALCAAFALPSGVAGQAEPPPLSAAVDVITVQEMARVEGQGETVLRGLGIVTGLKSTGDSAGDPVIARMLAEVYRANGNPIPDIKLLTKGKNAALVMLDCRVPREGARADDTLDVYVTAMHGATSLAGGRLYMAPLVEPIAPDPANPGSAEVYAFAAGPVEVEGSAVATSGIVRRGARLVRDVRMESAYAAIKGGSFTLVLEECYRAWTVTEQLAEAINSLPTEGEEGEDGSALTPIAKALDDVSVRVVVPPAERAQAARFMSRVMSASFSPSLLRLPAQVIINPRTGSIIVTGNVEISPVAIVHKSLSVTTITPPPVATPVTPLSTTTKGTALRTTERPSDRARVQDLLQALKQLDVPVEDQISILTQIHASGRLHARLLVQ
jgi:flagellar P-ring protein precursor FlgI